jgi:hypothetical protein
VRWTVALSLLACGPSSGESESGSAGAEDTSEEGGSTSDGGGTSTVAASSEEDGGTTGVGSTSSTDDAVDTSGSSDVSGGDTSTGEPPPICTMPDRPNADVFGTTSLGDVAMTAAVFAESGGGKCPDAYRVVLAADPAALADEIGRYEAGEPPIDVLELYLRLPLAPLEPGTWDEGELLHYRDGQALHAFDVTFEVTSVTAIDDPAAHVEASFMIVDDDFMFEGSFLAPYCDSVAGSACGA